MNKFFAVYLAPTIALVATVVAMTGLVHAQAGSAASAATQLIQSAAPTGPVSALTKVAELVRASRAAAVATRTATTAATTGAARTTAVMGYLWTANNSPISNATVQLRNTVSGNVEMYTHTNAYGEFMFNNIDGGSYVIEYVNNADSAIATAAGSASRASAIMAVGHPFSIAPGETVATFVRTLNNIPIFLPNVAGNVAASAVQTAASAGVTAVVTPIAPVVNPPPPPSSPNF